MLRSPRTRHIARAPHRKAAVLPEIYKNPNGLSTWRRIGEPTPNDIPTLPEVSGEFESLALIVARAAKVEIVASFATVAGAQHYLRESRVRVRSALKGDCPESAISTCAAWYIAEAQGIS